MARVIHVKKARKDNPAVKKGESYYHWTPYGSATQYSATYPKQSQLCGGKKSEIFATAEELEASIEGLNDPDDLKTACEEAAGEFRRIGEEYCESADNMPESLQYGEQAENMREQQTHLDTAVDNLEGLDFEFDKEEEDFEDEEEYQEARHEWLGELAEEALAFAVDVEVLF